MRWLGWLERRVVCLGSARPTALLFAPAHRLGRPSIDSHCCYLIVNFDPIDRSIQREAVPPPSVTQSIVSWPAEPMMMIRTRRRPATRCPPSIHPLPSNHPSPNPNHTSTTNSPHPIMHRRSPHRPCLGDGPPRRMGGPGAEYEAAGPRWSVYKFGGTRYVWMYVCVCPPAPALTLGARLPDRTDRVSSMYCTALALHTAWRARSATGLCATSSWRRRRRAAKRWPSSSRPWAASPRYVV